MSDLLTILKDITPFGMEHCFIRLCWLQLINVIGSKVADKWDSDKRYLFMKLSSFLIESGRSVFITRDALIRANIADLNRPLIGELSEHLVWLQEFASEVELKELDEMIRECTEILLNDEVDYWETVAIESIASYIRIFFHTVHALNIEERINLASQLSTN